MTANLRSRWYSPMLWVMKWVVLLWLFLLVVGACATRAPQVNHLTPADSTTHGGGHAFESLALAALIVLVLIPMMVPKR